MVHNYGRSFQKQKVHIKNLIFELANKIIKKVEASGVVSSKYKLQVLHLKYFPYFYDRRNW